MTAVRWVLALSLGLLAGLVVVGSALALVFEWHGFGTPRDQEPRVLHLVGYAALAVGAAAAAGWLMQRLLPRTTAWARIFVAVASVGLCVVLLGLLA